MARGDHAAVHARGLIWLQVICDALQVLQQLVLGHLASSAFELTEVSKFEICPKPQSSGIKARPIGMPLRLQSDEMRRGEVCEPVS